MYLIIKNEKDMKYLLNIKKVQKVTVFFVFVLLSTFNNSAHSQTYSDFHHAQTFNEKIQIADQIADYYSTTDLDTLKLIGTELLVEANKKKHPLGINCARQIIGMYYTRSENIDNGLRLLRLSKNYFVELEDYSKAAYIATAIGIGYQNAGKLQDAYNWYQQALHYADISEDEKVKYISLLNIARIYIAKKEYDNAKLAAVTYKDWAISADALENTANAYALLGTIYLEESEFTDAIEYFELSEDYAKKSKSDALIAHSINNIAIAKFIQGDQDESLSLFKKALQMRLKVKNPHYICDAYLNLGGIYFEMGRSNEAITEYTIGKKIARENKLIQNEIDLIKALIEVKLNQKVNTDQLEIELKHAQKQLEISKKENSKNDRLLNNELNFDISKQHNTQKEDNTQVLLIIGGASLLLILLIVGIKFIPR